VAGACQHGFGILVGREVKRDDLEHETPVGNLLVFVVRVLGHHDDIDITVQGKRCIRRQRRDSPP
jgi:hypothetical protein